MIGKRFVVFQAGVVDSNSVGSADDGDSLDLAAFDLNLLTTMTGTEDTVELTFAETGMFNAAAGVSAGGEDLTGTDVSLGLENSLVILTVSEGKEAQVIKDIAALANASQVHGVAVPVFDAVNSTYPISNVTGVSIRRTTTSRLVAKA
tara:strand:- start:52 stop:495 length:444 start_codon:yes stop_codon:yes gene_type:complete